MSKLQETVRQAIREAPVSRYRIAKDLGISEAALSLFANGKRNIGLDYAERILNYLDYEIVVVKRKGKES